MKWYKASNVRYYYNCLNIKVKSYKLLSFIPNEIINDSTLRESEDGLEKAYARVIEKKYVPESELVKDENFLTNYI